jgi:hypothetical protein
MHRRAQAVATFFLLALTHNAIAQGAAPAPAPTSQLPAQQVPAAIGIPPCATLEQQTAALGAKTPSGSEKLAGQPAERSGILPSAGTAGAASSAAPTMQQDGQTYRSPLDCPLVSNHPNALPPGSVPNLPQLSK